MTGDAGSALQELRLFVVEDEVMVGMALKTLLLTFGCKVIGPVVYLDQAITIAHEVEADGAILDVNIAGEKIFPVADILTERGIPFLFATGYGGAGLRECDKIRPVLQKPYPINELTDILAQWKRTASKIR